MFVAGKAQLVVRCMAVVVVLVLAVSPSDAFSKAKSKGKKAASAGRPYSALIIEADTGRIVHDESGDAIRHPASLTKMMTLYLAFQAIENKVIRLDTMLPVSANAASQSPSKLGLRAGERIQAYDAMMALVTQSANDASVVLAEALGGTVGNFARMMVEQARALGMNKTVFRNPNGLPDPQQVTSARDMAILGHALIYHYPGFYGYFSRTSFTYKGRSYNNHNHLMKRYEGMDGIKTGYINASGFNLVASAERNNKRLIGVIFGGRSAVSRDNKLSNLLDLAFEKVQTGAVRQAGFVTLPNKVSIAFASSPRTQRAETPQPRPETRVVEQEQTLRPPVGAVADEGNVEVEETHGAWGIQIGAFSAVDPAQKYLASMARIMAPLLAEAEQSLQKVTMTDGSAMYRARFTGLDHKTARDACTYMVKHGQSCLVVSGP